MLLNFVCGASRWGKWGTRELQIENLSSNSMRDVCRRKDNVPGAIFGIISSLWAQVFILDKCKSYRYSDMNGRSGTSPSYFPSLNLAVTWNLGLCMTLILYHLYFPRQSQPEYFSVLYVNVLLAVPFLIWNLEKEKCH